MSRAGYGWIAEALMLAWGSVFAVLWMPAWFTLPSAPPLPPEVFLRFRDAVPAASEVMDEIGELYSQQYAIAQRGDVIEILDSCEQLTADDARVLLAWSLLIATCAAWPTPTDTDDGTR